MRLFGRMRKPYTYIKVTFTFETQEQAERGREAASNFPSMCTLSPVMEAEGLYGFDADDVEGNCVAELIKQVRAKAEAEA